MCVYGNERGGGKHKQTQSEIATDRQEERVREGEKERENTDRQWQRGREREMKKYINRQIDRERWQGRERDGYRERAVKNMLLRL